MKAAPSRAVAAGYLAIAIATVIASGCGGAASRLASHMERGRKYYADGDFVHASIEFRNALQIAPKDNAARLMAGRTAESLGKAREAVGLYQAVIDSAPDDVEAHARLGRLYALAGAPDRALTLIEPALAKHPDDALLLVDRAAARLQMKNVDGAVADADHALKVAPTDAEAIALRAGLYRQGGDIAHATALVSDAVGKLPQSTELRDVLVSLYVAGNDLTKAEEQLQALTRLKPTELRYRKQLALFYSRAHKLDEAQRVLETAVKDFPKNDDAKLTLVGFLTNQRTREQGEKTLREFIAAAPDDYDLRFGLADLLLHRSAPKEAADVYDEIIRRDGTGAKGLLARDQLAAMYLEQGRDDDARKLIDVVLQKSAHDDGALLLRGEMALKRSDPASAVADLRAVLRDQPQSVPIQRMLAQAHLKNGAPALAEEALRTAMYESPNDVSVRIELAQLLMQTQRPEQATPILEEAVRKNPSDVRAREALVRTYMAKHDLVAARTAAEDLKTLNPSGAVGFYLAGVIAQQQGRLDDGEKDLDRAVELQPNAIDALGALTKVELDRGKAAQAIARVQKVVDANPKSALPLNLLGEVYIATKNFPGAIDALMRATQVAPTWGYAYRNLAIARIGAKDSAGAVATYEAGVKAAPNDIQLLVELASYYERQGRANDAISLYEDLYKRNPKLQLAANNLALLLATYRTDKTSLDRARDLSAPFVSSDNGALLDTNGWVHYKRGEAQDALPILERALVRAPDSQVIRYHLALAELDAGQTDRARTNLETALSGAADFSGVEHARAVLARLKQSG
jgi:tetratricopeptide (TPR) repeat protein